MSRQSTHNCVQFAEVLLTRWTGRGRGHVRNTQIWAAQASLGTEDGDMNCPKSRQIYPKNAGQGVPNFTATFCRGVPARPALYDPGMFSTIL